MRILAISGMDGMGWTSECTSLICVRGQNCDFKAVSHTCNVFAGALRYHRHTGDRNLNLLNISEKKSKNLSLALEDKSGEVIHI